MCQDQEPNDIDMSISSFYEDIRVKLRYSFFRSLSAALLGAYPARLARSSWVLVDRRSPPSVPVTDRSRWAAFALLFVLPATAELRYPAPAW